MKLIFHTLLLLAFILSTPFSNEPPRVELEEIVYTYTPADNGSSPMWCHGNTSIVRVGDELYASGIETVSGVKPLNNCLPTLFHRTENGWEMIYKGEGRTREPSPLAAFHNGRIFLSLNTTLTTPDTYYGPAQPQILEIRSGEKETKTLLPVWQGEPPFTEHSYRSFAADGENGELILFQNIEYDHVEWTFLDHSGQWSAQGKLPWPWGDNYAKPQPVRVCYPAVALKNRAVHFLGVSDIEEPNPEWRKYKKQLTGRDWDYDFRRLFYTWSDDITTGKFHDWVEISSRDKTGGWIFPMDLHIASNGDVFVLWSERALDERLREKYFPSEKQCYSLKLAILRDGKVIERSTLVQGGEDFGGERPGDGRFHITEDGSLFVFCYVSGTDAQGQALSEQRLIEIDSNGKSGQSTTLKLENPLSTFFTSTPRAGSKPSPYLDLFGAVGNTMRYVRIRIL